MADPLPRLGDSVVKEDSNRMFQHGSIKCKKSVKKKKRTKNTDAHHRTLLMLTPLLQTITEVTICIMLI